jgi:hypothetical protein
VDLSRSAIGLVREMKSAIARADGELRKNELKITRVELELKTVIEKSGGGGISISVVEIDGDVTRTDSNTLTLTLVPSKRGVQLMSPPSDQLVDAILATASAAWEAADSPPAFDLQEATVSIEVGVTAEGKIKVIAHGGASRDHGHTMTITLSPL